MTHGSAAVFVNEGAGSAHSGRVRRAIGLTQRALGADRHVIATRDIGEREAWVTAGGSFQRWPGRPVHGEIARAGPPWPSGRMLRQRPDRALKSAPSGCGTNSCARPKLQSQSWIR